MYVCTCAWAPSLEHCSCVISGQFPKLGSEPVRMAGISTSKDCGYVHSNEAAGSFLLTFSTQGEVLSASELIPTGGMGSRDHPEFLHRVTTTL